MEDYAAKMQLKSEAALREYVTGHFQYRDEAVLAALAELERRGYPAPEAAELRPRLEAAVREQQAATQAATAAEVPASGPPAPAEAATPPDDNAPALYTPGVIVLFSVLFHFITGAVLLAMNFNALGRRRAIWALAGFVVAYIAGEMLLLEVLKEHYGTSALNPILLAALNLPAILSYILWFWPRYVGGSQFRSRGWLLPLGICFVLVLVLQALLLYAARHLPGGAQLLPPQAQ